MAQKKQAQYTGAMDSVFDFIYSESKKTPAKVKPVKVTGLDSSDPYVAAAMAALENPLLFVNDTTVGAIKDAANLKIHDFTGIDAKGGGGKAGFSLFNVGDVLNNNLKFVDNAFAKMEGARKAGRMSAWGKTLSAMTASSMALEMGLDSQTRRMLSLTARDNRTDVVTNYELSKRSVDLARSLTMAGNVPDTTEKELQNLLENAHAFDSKKRAKEMYADLQDMKAKYEAEMRKPEDQRNFDDIFSKAGSRDMHLFFEDINFEMMASEARKKAKSLDANSKEAKKLMQQAQGYEDMKGVMLTLDKSDKYQKDIFNKYIGKKSDDLKKLKEDLKGGNLTPERAKEIKNEIKSIESQVRSFNLQKGAYDLGALETQISSVKQLWEYSVGGGLLPAIINGDFYDKNKNSAYLFFNQNISLQPRSDTKFSFYVFDKDGNLVMDKNGKPVERKFSGLASEYGGQNEMLKNVMGSYYEGMMDIYYRFTPKGIIENLTTGNGTARQAFKERMKIIAEFRESDLGKLFTDKEILELESFFTSPDFKGLEGKLGAARYAQFMEYFGKNKDKFEKFNKLINRANSFNLINRLKDRFTETNFYKKTIGAASEAFAGWMGKLLQKMVKDGPARDQITKLFAGKLGLKAVSEGLKIAIKSYLSTTTAGLGAFASTLVDWAVDLGMSVVEKMAKPVVKFLISGAVFGIVGLIGIVIMFGIILFAPSKTMKTLGSYSHVAPYEIVLGETDYVVPIEEPVGPEGPGIPGEWAGGPSLPDGVSCLLGSNGETYRCSQGPYGNFSHSRLNAIDIAYGGVFYAPSFCGKGNCVIEYYGDFSCTAIGAGNAITLRAEYQGHVYRFIMYHVTLSSQLSMGSQVSSGQAVGQMLINGTVSGCWTGPHLHLEIDYDGVRVNPYDVLVSDPSSGGFGCSVSTCP